MICQKSCIRVVREEAKWSCSVLTGKRDLETLVADNVCIRGNQSYFNSNVMRTTLKKAFIHPYIPTIPVLNPFLH